MKKINYNVLFIMIYLSSAFSFASMNDPKNQNSALPNPEELEKLIEDVNPEVDYAAPSLESNSLGGGKKKKKAKKTREMFFSLSEEQIETMLSSREGKGLVTTPPCGTEATQMFLASMNIKENPLLLYRKFPLSFSKLKREKESGLNLAPLGSEYAHYLNMKLQSHSHRSNMKKGSIKLYEAFSKETLNPGEFVKKALRCFRAQQPMLILLKGDPFNVNLETYISKDNLKKYSSHLPKGLKDMNAIQKALNLMHYLKWVPVIATSKDGKSASYMNIDGTVVILKVQDLIREMDCSATVKGLKQFLPLHSFFHFVNLNIAPLEDIEAFYPYTILGIHKQKKAKRP